MIPFGSPCVQVANEKGISLAVFSYELKDFDHFVRPGAGMLHDVITLVCWGSCLIELIQKSLASFSEDFGYFFWGLLASQGNIENHLEIQANSLIGR